MIHKAMSTHGRDKPWRPCFLVRAVYSMCKSQGKEGGCQDLGSHPPGANILNNQQTYQAT